MDEKTKEGQGHDPRSQVFTNLYPVLYAAETPVSRSYVGFSIVAATIADTLINGLRGKSILDVGCGYGTTTAALADFSPRKITAIDNSTSMIELFSTVTQSKVDIDTWLKAKNADEVLGELCLATVNHLKQRRAEFQSGVFSRNGGSLSLKAMSSLDLSPWVGMFDAIIGVNFLHWPVNQRKATLKHENPTLGDDELTDRAVVDALRPIADVMLKGAVAVFMEPKDFMTFDNDPEREADYERNTYASASLFRKFHETFNWLLKQHYGIDRTIPKTTGLFKASKLEQWFAASGLRLQRIVHAEQTWTCNPIMAMFVRLPLMLGTINIPFEDKIRLGKMTVEKFRRTVTPEELTELVRTQSFYLCVDKP